MLAVELLDDVALRTVSMVMSHTDAIDPAMVTPSQKPIPSTPARQLPLPGLRGHTPPSAFERPLPEKTPRPTLDRPPPRQRRRALPRRTAIPDQDGGTPPAPTSRSGRKASPTRPNRPRSGLRSGSPPSPTAPLQTPPPGRTPAGRGDTSSEAKHPAPTEHPAPRSATPGLGAPRPQPHRHRHQHQHQSAPSWTAPACTAGGYGRRGGRGPRDATPAGATPETRS